MESPSNPVTVPDAVPTATPGATPSPASAVPAADDLEAITPLAIGVPDGTGVTTPYAYWTVKDAAGTPVAGATFSFQRRNSSNTGWQSPALTAPDCIATPCTGVDRDSDPGEFLVKWIGSDTPGAPGSGTTITAGSRYRIQPSAAPTGYGWISGTGWVDSNNGGWTGSGNSRTLNFGGFVVRSLRPACTAGTAYAVSAAGQLQQLSTSGGAAEDVGTAASGVDGFNGLGIGSDGLMVYAFERSVTSGSENATVWTFNTTTGTWNSTGASTSSLGGNTGTYLVGGAVNPIDGRYYFGGYASGTGAGNTFKLYRYDPTASSRITLKGTITTSAGTGENGDFAFDRAGNMYLTRGSGTAQTVFTIAAGILNAATGGTIAPSASRSFTTTLSNINGVALDGNGWGLLGVANAMDSYDLPDWSNRASRSITGLDSSDLASCSFPPTLTVEKYLEGARVAAGDQFALTLQRGSTVLGTATTDGPATGLQTRTVGALPVVRGVSLGFSEAAAGGANLGQYHSRYVCRADGVVAQQGSGASGTFSLPATGEAFVCTLYNVRRTATLTVHKDLADLNGANPVPSQGWTVGVEASATTGTVTASPTATTQATDTAGNATWTLTLGTASDRATARISEQQQTGYQFLRGQCVLTRADGSTTTTTLTSGSAQAVTGIAPGDALACSYTNRPTAGSISWQKVSNDTPAVAIGPSGWTVQGPGSGGPSRAFQDCIGTAANCAGQPDTDERAGYLRVGGLAWGDYVVTETSPPAGFQRPATVAWPVSITAQNAASGATFGPVVNTRLLGAASWTKVDLAAPSNLLAGAAWQLSGPTGAAATAPSADLAVADCVAAQATACTGADKDPGAGRFRVTGLAWGEYRLTEAKAPPGYVVDPTPRTFSVLVGNAGTEIAVGAIGNQAIAPVTLPLTGGLARDHYTLAGIAVMALAGAGFGVTQRRSRRTRTG